MKAFKRGTEYEKRNLKLHRVSVFSCFEEKRNLTDAEDLTQEILLAALSYLNRGGVITNMPAWLSSTLNHKWSDMLRKKYKLPTISIDVVADELEEESIPDEPSA